MSVLKIYTFPDRILKQKALAIPRVERSVYPLVDSMLETMYAAPGIGLAANQVGILKRLIVIDLGSEPDSDAENPEATVQPPAPRSPQVLINPEIVAHHGQATFLEGCLSIPEFRAEVKRWDKIKVKYLDVQGLEQTLSAEGLLSICIQHEIDHLNGHLFIDHLTSVQRKLVQKRLLDERLKAEKQQ